MPREYIVGFVLAAALILLGLLWFPVASRVGDQLGQIASVADVLAGAILAARDVRARSQWFKDRAARDQFFRDADASTQSGGSARNAAGAPDPSRSPSTPSPTPDIAGERGDHATASLMVSCPTCGVFEPREGSIYCRSCGRPLPAPALTP